MSPAKCHTGVIWILQGCVALECKGPGLPRFSWPVSLRAYEKSRSLTSTSEEGSYKCLLGSLLGSNLLLQMRVSLSVQLRPISNVC